jgi:hypothetical protein
MTMVDMYGVELKVGDRVYHSDEVDESFGLVTQVTEETFSILWDGDSDSKVEKFLLSFGRFISVQV